ncbi:MAG: hypothetical protein V4510_12575 [bacterium]
MALRLLLVASALMLVLSGCSQPSDDGSGPIVAPPPMPIIIPYDQAGCSESIGLLLVDPAPVQAALPPGYTWRDASDLLGLPAPTGKAALGFNVVSCGSGPAGAGEAFEGIFVHPPTIANVSAKLPAATLDIYQLSFYSGNATLQATLTQFGVPGGPLAVGGQITDTAAASIGDATAQSGGMPIHALQLVAAGPQQSAVLARFWTQTSNGTAVIDYNVDEPASQGTLVSCSFGATAPIAKTFAITSCSGQSTAALRFPVQAWKGSIRLVPTGASL